MIQKNLLALIFIIKCLLKRFKTEGNTYSLKRLQQLLLKLAKSNTPYNMHLFNS